MYIYIYTYLLGPSLQASQGISEYVPSFNSTSSRQSRQSKDKDAQKQFLELQIWIMHKLAIQLNGGSDSERLPLIFPIKWGTKELLGVSQPSISWG